MVNFILCDDDKNYLTKVKNTIDKYMMKNNLEYKAHLFNDYDDKFIKIVEENIPSKIYILDIETPSGSGVDIARIIRKNDINSVIIFLTGHQELSDVVIKDDFLFLSFINKFDACEKRLNDALGKALKVLKIRPKLKFKENGFIYNIALEDILYVSRDTFDRKCQVKTDNMEFKLTRSLSSMEELLPDNFMKSHRSCIVNTNRIVSIDRKGKLITFDNGTTTDLVSEKFISKLL